MQPEINELPPQQPKAKIKLPAAEDVRKCKTFEQLRELAKNAYAEIGKVDRDGMRLIDVMDVRQSALKQTFKLVFLEKHPGKAWKMSPYDMLDEKMADKIVNTTDDFSFEDVERIVREAFEKHPIPEESLVDEVPEEPRNMEAFEHAVNGYDEGEE